MVGYWCTRRTTLGQVLILGESRKLRLAQLSAGRLLPRIEFDRLGSLSAMIEENLDFDKTLTYIKTLGNEKRCLATRRHFYSYSLTRSSCGIFGK